MMKLIKLFLLNIFLIAMISGCDRLGGNAGTAVIDLTAVSKATGQDEVIKTKMDNAAVELNAQLSEAAGVLEGQLAEKKEKLGASPTQEQVKDLQQFAVSASQQLKQNQAVAQQKAQQYKMDLLLEWRKDIQPAVAEVARKHNAKVVMASSPSLMWFDESIDITGEVIAALRATPMQTPALESNAPDSSENAEPSTAAK